MIGACTLAVVALSGFGIVVVKNEEGGPAHVICVVVDKRMSGPLLIVVDWHEEFTIVPNHRPSLTSQVICPLIGAVGIGTFILFRSPRVSDLNKFDF